jgi:hypothetical protein
MRRRDIVVWCRFAAGMLGLVLVPACDCFFDVRGRVVECGTAVPVAGATIDLMIDRGFQDRQASYPNAGTTDATGRFSVGANEPCESWGTLTFKKDGFVTLVPPQFKRSPKNDVELCMTRVAAP